MVFGRWLSPSASPRPVTSRIADVRVAEMWEDWDKHAGQTPGTDALR